MFINEESKGKIPIKLVNYAFERIIQRHSLILWIWTNAFFDIFKSYTCINNKIVNINSMNILKINSFQLLNDFQVGKLNLNKLQKWIKTSYLNK